MSRSFDENDRDALWNDVVKFNPELNVIILSRSKLQSPYFNTKYPVSVNFARIGRDFADTMLNAIDTFNKEYMKQPRIAKRNITLSSNTNTNIKFIPYGNDVLGDSLRCVENKIPIPGDHNIPDSVIRNLHHQIRQTKLTARSFKSFLKHLDDNRRIEASEISEKVSFDTVGLRNRKRQPGLRQYNDEQLFALTYLQNFCAVASQSYDRIKPFTEDAIPNRDLYDRFFCVYLNLVLICVNFFQIWYSLENSKGPPWHVFLFCGPPGV